MAVFCDRACRVGNNDDSNLATRPRKGSEEGIIVVHGLRLIRGGGGGGRDVASSLRLPWDTARPHACRRPPLERSKASNGLPLVGSRHVDVAVESGLDGLRDTRCVSASVELTNRELPRVVSRLVWVWCRAKIGRARCSVLSRKYKEVDKKEIFDLDGVDPPALHEIGNRRLPVAAHRGRELTDRLTEFWLDILIGKK